MKERTMLKLPIASFSKSGFLLGAGLALATATVKILLLKDKDEETVPPDGAGEEADDGTLTPA